MSHELLARLVVHVHRHDYGEPGSGNEFLFWFGPAGEAVLDMCEIGTGLR